MTEPEFQLALRQLEELANLYGKKSTLVRMAQKLHQQRKAWKQKFKLFCYRLSHKPQPKPASQLKILIHVRGGIGDVCMTRLFVARLRELLSTAQLYFCYDHKATVDMVFADGLIDGYVPQPYDPRNYDLVITGCHAFRFDYMDKVRLQQLAPEWMPALEKAQKLQEKLAIVTDNTPHLDGLWAKISVEYGSSRVANMGLTAGVLVGQNDRVPLEINLDKLANTLTSFGLSNKKYITIHDGTNTNTDLHGRAATRCWPRANWEQFGRLFKQQFPDIQIVQLGASNSVPFDFADVCLVGKTQVADLPYLLEGALLHVDGESGMTQLANLTSTRAVVMFGPTPVKYFGYERNINLRAGKCRECMCIEPDWMSKCALFETNRCLHAITPQKVLEAVKQALD